MARKLIDPAVIGRKGGKATAANRTAEQRRDAARKAVSERWRRYREAKEQAKKSNPSKGQVIKKRG